MAKKVTDLIVTTTLQDADKIMVVTDTATTPTSKGISTSDLTAAIGSSPLASNPIENEYADITALLADQASQTTAFFQYVIDASDDPEISSGDAYYEKLSTSTTTLATDYRLLSDTEETVIVTGSNSYRVFKISAVQDDTSPLSTVSGGKIGVEFNTGTGKVTGFLFNKITSTSIANIITQSASQDFYFNSYNKKNNTYEIAKITGFATVNTDFELASVENTITAADMGVNDRLEVFFDVDVSSVDPTQFLRSDIADSKTSGTLTFDDDVLLKLGDSTSGFTMSHNGTEPIFSMVVGNLLLKDGANLRFTYGRTSGNFTNTGNIISQGVGNNSFIGGVSIGKSIPDGLLNLASKTNAAATINNDASNYALTLDLTTGSGTNDIERSIAFRDPGGLVVSAINAIDAGATGATSLGFYTGNTASLSEAVRITDGGDVGIGTDTPNTKLEIRDGSGTVIGGFASGQLHVTNPSADINANAVITGHNLNNGNRQLWYLGSVSSGNNDIAFINRRDGDLFFSTNNNERVRIKSDGDVDITGSLIAIGSITGSNLSGTNTGDETKASIDALGVDAATLDSIDSLSFLRSDVADIKTSGDLTFNDNVALTLGTGNDALLKFDATNLLLDLQTTATSFIIRNVTTPIVTIGRTTGDFTNTGTINSSGTGDNSFVGFLGIGLNNPKSELHVSNGNGSTETEQGKISFTGDSSTKAVTISGFRRGNSNQAALDFKVFNSGVIQAVRIDFNGDVGIGTVTPNQKLTIEGTMSLKEQANANADTAAYGQIWVKNTVPNTLFFTDDAGTDFPISGDPPLGFAIGDETTDLSVATGVLTITMPNYATTLLDVSVSLVTAPTGSVATFDINEAGVSVLSTKITIDATEKTSETAATPPVISDSAIAANAVITVDVDGIGSTIAGAGGKVWLYIERA